MSRDDSKFKPKERHRKPYYRHHDREERRYYHAGYFYSGEAWNMTFEKSLEAPPNTKINLMHDSVFNAGINQDDWDDSAVNNQQEKVNKQVMRHLNRRRHMIDPKQ